MENHMAVTDEGLTLPVSTGAVKTPSDPEVVEVPVTNESTGAVSFDASPVEVRFGPSGQKPAGNVETPGPETTVNPSVKVVNAPAKHAAKGSSTAETENSSGR
jgi:hypothetical protein